MDRYELKNRIIDLIVKERQKDPGGYEVDLYLNSQNGLMEVLPPEIESILYELQNKDKVIEVLGEHYPKTPPGATVADLMFSENIYYELCLRPEFDNWYQAYRYSQSIDLSDLTQNNLELVVTCINEMYAHFEMNHNPTITIGWIVADMFVGTTSASKRNALNYLKNKGIVKDYDFHEEEMQGCIIVEVYVDRFINFKKKLDSFLSPKNKRRLDKAQDRDIFLLPDGVKWEGITIRFLDGHNVRIQAQAKAWKMNYKDMGFEDGRKPIPNQQWELLRDLAENHGQISWQDATATNSNKKKKQRLAKILKEFFSLNDDPFYPYKKEQAYRIKINLLPENASS